jgi:integrase-like protein
MNSTRDIVFKRCGCTDADAGRQLASHCPQLAEPGHGSWYYAVQVATVGGRKARYRRGGFVTREAAAAARQAIIDGPADEAAAGAWTVARWLRYWLAQAEPHLRPSTLHGYRDHIDRYLIPSIGRITLADLTSRRLQACFNPLAHLRLDKPVRPHPVIWTDERVEAWRRDGIRPQVGVWTLRQLITFLTGVEEIALDEAGTRRLVDQAVKQTVELLRHQFTEQRRSDSRARTGPGWRQGRALFTYADGRPIRPEYLTHRFHVLVKELDLPPIRLHDLRHGAATIALAPRTDLKVIQQMLAIPASSPPPTPIPASCQRPPTGPPRPPPT